MPHIEQRKKPKASRLSPATYFHYRSIYGLALCSLAFASSSRVCEAQSGKRLMPNSPIADSQSAIPAILTKFDSYEVVGMSEAHELQDVDDLILSHQNPRIC